MHFTEPIFINRDNPHINKRQTPNLRLRACRLYLKIYSLLKEKLLGNDLTVFYFIYHDLIKFLSSDALKGDIHTHSAGEKVAGNQGCGAISAMHLFYGLMKVHTFFDDLVQSLHAFKRTSCRFYAPWPLLKKVL